MQNSTITYPPPNLTVFSSFITFLLYNPKDGTESFLLLLVRYHSPIFCVKRQLPHVGVAHLRFEIGDNRNNR